MASLPVAGNIEPPRAARVEDLPDLLETVNQVMRVSRGSAPTIASDWAHIYDPANVANIMIVRAGRTVAGSVGIWANEVEIGQTRLKVGGINCLATLPEFRRGGLGARLMEAAHRRMRELGCHAGLLSTGIVAWYRKLGWEHGGTSCAYRFNRSNIGLLPRLDPAARLRVTDSGACAEVVRLRRDQRLGGVRDAEIFRRTVDGRGKPKFILAEREGKAFAYLIAWDMNVIEWGGAAADVAGLVRGWFEANDDVAVSASQRDDKFQPAVRDQLSIVAPAFGHPFVGMLESLRLPCSVGYHGMMFVLDAGGILGAFGIADIAAEETREGLTLRRGRESVSLTRPQAVKLFFGPERISAFAEDVFPLPFWQWPLEHV